MSKKKKVAEFRRNLAAKVLQGMCDQARGEAVETNELSKELGHTPDAIRKEIRKFQGYPTWTLNPFATAYCWQYFIDIKLNQAQIAELGRAKDLRHILESKEPLEALVDWVIGELRKEEYGGHIIVRNAYILHGSGDRDVTFMVYTDDGLATLGSFIRNKVVLTGCADTLTCTEVGWNKAFRGHSGQRLSGEISEEEKENGTQVLLETASR